MLRLAFTSLAVTILLAACGGAKQCTVSEDCGAGVFACKSGKCVNLDDTSSGAGTAASGSTGTGSHATSTGAGGHTTTGAGGHTTTGSGAGGSIDPAGCLASMNCAGNGDCAMGDHCNLALVPPQCEKLYCGGEGTTCSEDPLCVPGLKCVGGACRPCASPKTVCSGACVDTLTDPAHCGVCSNACATNTPCVNGFCKVAMCAPKCAINQDCQSTCPASQGAVTCCDPATAVCFYAAGSSCPN